ncbi:fimbrial chaperone protein StdC, partial [Salmonella enterica]
GSAAPEQKMEILLSGRTLTLKNPTPYYVTLIWLGQSPKHKLAGFKEGTMVAPFSEQTVNTVPPAGDQLLVGNIDDYGAMRMNRFTCTAEKCTFRERIHE